VRIRDLEKAEGVKPFASSRFLDAVESLSIITMTCQILYGLIFFASIVFVSFAVSSCCKGGYLPLLMAS